MQSTIKRCTLAIIMCGLSAIGMAQEKLIDEDFSTFDFKGISWGDNGQYVNGWKMKYCTLIETHLYKDVYYLKIEKENSSSTKKGWAYTPALNYTGDVILSFKYGKTTSDNSQITVSTNDKSFFSDTNGSSRSFTISNHIDKGLNTATFLIKEVTPTTKIQFSLNSDKYFAIDDVVVTKDILGENADNQYYIAAHEGNTTDVQTTRTLIGGIWNTLCLPFNVTKATMEAALGTDQDIQMRTFSSYADNVMTFDAVADDAVISAGTPFLIKLNTTVDNPTFNSVTISNTAAQTINNNGVSLVGTYSTTTLNADGTHLFITTDGKLAIPTSDGTTMKGMRAYISVPSALAPTVSGARLVFNDINDDEPSSVQTPTRKKTPSAIYNLNGQRLKQPRKGLNIIDGKLRVTTTR